MIRQHICHLAKKIVEIATGIVVFLLFSTMMSAQDLPQLKQAAEVKKGNLDCGVQYFLVTNSSFKGLADVAVVQPQSGIVDIARLSLTSLAHAGKAPYKFFASKGINFGPEGYAYYPGDGRFYASQMDSTSYGKKRTPTIYRFENVPTNDAAAMDTTLLLAFDLISSNPYAQALVVSGDIAADKILSKIQLFSMMVSPRSKVPSFPSYKWNPSETANCEIAKVGISEGLASVTVEYASPRTPKNMINTIQPLVAEMFSDELETIVGRRISEVFSQQNIPLAESSLLHLDSGRTEGDEKYAFNVVTNPANARKAMLALAQVLSELDMHGATMGEYADAKGKLVAKVFSEPSKPFLSNSTYVEKCINAYLYGGSLASMTAFRDYLSTRKIPSTQELDLFNNFVSALLDPARNLTIRVNGADVGEDPTTAFFATWKRQSSVSAGKYPSLGDKASDISTSTAKCKLQKTEKEPLSGGEVWTFSNGIRVVYKNMPGNDRFGYALQIKGGTASIKGILPAESAFVSDILDLYKVGDLSGKDFRSMLAAKGVLMNTNVSESDIRITGTAPMKELELVLHSLIALANNRKMDLQAYEKYRTDEILRIELAKNRAFPKAELENLMAPGISYSEWKTPEGLTDELPVKADKYFQSQFGNVNDGILVLTGSMEPEDLKKILAKNLGSFRSGKRVTVRPVIDFPLRTGSTTSKIDASIDRIDIQATALLSYTVENIMASEIARMVLRKSLVTALVDNGMHLEMDWKFGIFPKENFTVWFSLTPVDEDGLPSHGINKEVSTVLMTVEKALAKAATSPISGGDLANYKNQLLAEVQAAMASPEGMMQLILTRYADGKNLLSRNAEVIKAITVANVQAVLKALSEGSMTEIIRSTSND